MPSIWMQTALALMLLPSGALTAEPAEDGPPLFTTRRDMVLVRATVTDVLGRPMAGLEQRDFQLFDRKIEQQIEYFTAGGAPLSVGFLLDISGSMAPALHSARQAIVQFLQESHPADEYFLITFNDRVSLLQDLTSDPEEILSQAASTGADGRTALFDALYLGLERMRQTNNTHKTLILITDTQDNFSRFSPDDIRDFLLESEVQLYLLAERRALALAYEDPWQSLVRKLLMETVEQSGGRSYFPSNPNQLEYFCSLIHQELRSQYLLGYTPSGTAPDGKWRKIKLRVQAPDGFPRLSLRYKKGYYPAIR